MLDEKLEKAVEELIVDMRETIDQGLQMGLSISEIEEMGMKVIEMKNKELPKFVSKHILNKVIVLFATYKKKGEMKWKS